MLCIFAVLVVVRSGFIVLLFFGVFQGKFWEGSRLCWVQGFFAGGVGVFVFVKASDLLGDKYILGKGYSDFYGRNGKTLFSLFCK